MAGAHDATDDPEPTNRGKDCDAHGNYVTRKTVHARELTAAARRAIAMPVDTLGGRRERRGCRDVCLMSGVC